MVGRVAPFLSTKKHENAHPKDWVGASKLPDSRASEYSWLSSFTEQINYILIVFVVND
jgi:hypothetical protein